MRIAIIGSGISGLSACYILGSQDENEVVLFEKGDQIGFDAYSLQFGEKRVDCPPRTFSTPFYPNLLKLYEMAGIDIEENLTNYSVSVVGEWDAPLTASELVLYGFRLPSLGWQLLSSTTLRMVYDGFRFWRNMFQQAPSEDFSHISVEQYVKDGGYSKAFVNQILLPFLSMIATCSYEACLQYPIDVFMRYLGVSSTKGNCTANTAQVSERLSGGAKEIHLNTEVIGVWQAASANTKARVQYYKKGSTTLVDEYFDTVIIASQASAALKMLKDPTKLQQEALSRFQHEYSDAAIHRDTRLMPKNPNNWTELNFIMNPKHSDAMTTLWATKMIPLEEKQGNIFLTWNPVVDIKPELLIQKATFERPILTTSSLQAVNLLKKAQGIGNIWFCGAYATYSVPLQESCVESAIEVAESIGVQCSWKSKRWYLDEKYTSNDKTYSLVALSLSIGVPMLATFAYAALRLSKK